MTEVQAHLLMRIANLWCGDWSGHVFDGRDGKRWIMAVIRVDRRGLQELSAELAQIEKEYEND